MTDTTRHRLLWLAALAAGGVAVILALSAYVGSDAGIYLSTPPFPCPFHMWLAFGEQPASRGSG